ncbi:MAG: hypothetical protein K2I42_05615 [Anaeroplasmataceae bacterium]|nr:hypothetical protein [Anaeroplasmataceae bacterium]
MKSIKILDTKEKELLFLFVQVDLFGEEALSRKNLMAITELSRPTLNKELKILLQNQFIKVAKKNREEIYILNKDHLI